MSKEEKWYGLFLGDKLISTRVEGHCDIKHWKEAIDLQLGRHPFSINTLIDQFIVKLDELEGEETTLEELKGVVLGWKELEGKKVFETQSIWEMDIDKGRKDDNKVRRVY